MERPLQRHTQALSAGDRTDGTMARRLAWSLPSLEGIEIELSAPPGVWKSDAGIGSRLDLPTRVSTSSMNSSQTLSRRDTSSRSQNLPEILHEADCAGRA